MCGVVGYVGAGARAMSGRVEAAREQMRHRGPDDAGLYVDDTACLGSRRLAGLDLSPAGHMPMLSRDERYALLFNGEIYHHLELRAELFGAIPLHSTRDTPGILNRFF